MVESIIVFFSHGGTVGCRVVVGFEKRSGNEVPKCCHKRGGGGWAMTLKGKE